MNIQDEFGSLRKGLLELLVLKVISFDKVYVADIVTRLETTDFSTGEGTLYPLLSRLRRAGMVDYEWVESEAGPPRKYYSLTATGKDRLSDLERYWQHINKTIIELGDNHE
jgi:PadR family transcriptional regulator PadR